MKIRMATAVAAVICFVFLASSVPHLRVELHAYKFPEYPPAFGDLIIPSDNPTTVEGVWLGRLLFYDSLLSINKGQSCASCHQQELAFSDGKKLAVGTLGDTISFNSMSLVNLVFERNFFWDGRAKTIEEQIPQPILNTHEMAQNENELVKRLLAHRYYPQLFAQVFPDDSICMRTVSKAIAQFLRTIISSGLTFPAYIQPKRNANGEPDTVFMNLHRKELSIPGAIYRLSYVCLGCHNTATYGGGMADNEVVPGARFKVPSLINIGLTAPYMHDGRFKTLKDVLKHYKAHLASLEVKNPSITFPAPITDTITEFDLEHADEIFRYFTDSTLITNPAFANPFARADFNWFEVGGK